jgi:hypothetical protein
MSRVYAAHFKTYLGAMEKMQVSCAGPGDLLGAADSGAAASMASVMAMFGGKQQGKASVVSGWWWYGAWVGGNRVWSGGGRGTACGRRLCVVLHYQRHPPVGRLLNANDDVEIRISWLQVK